MIDQILENFWDKVKVDPVTGCWNWLGSKNTKGYGQFWDDNKKWILAHRFAYQVNKGKIIEGMNLDHLCRNRACVNPEHLEQVTVKENILRGLGLAAINSKKTHCPKGHSLSNDNLFVRQDGRRECRACMRTSLQKSRKKQKELS